MTEKVEAKDTETEAAPKKVAVIKKRNTQETFTSSRGNKYLFMFTNTKKVQDMLDSTLRPDGIRSPMLLAQVIMENIIEGNEYSFEYFDKKIANKDKSDSITLTDEDGNEIKTYDFKWPGLVKYEQMNEKALNQYGVTTDSKMFEGLMKNVIQGDIDWKYWDEHEGYTEVMTAASDFVEQTFAKSEFAEVMQAATNFVNRKFQ
jgi:hypothetical protein